MKTNAELRIKYPHIYRKKSLCELLRLSAAVMGIELAYSAETAFVSPILLELGLRHDNMIEMWALSPAFGLCLAPLIGIISDKCTLSIGRRRPFIIGLSLTLLIGIIFVPYGKDIGMLFGDTFQIQNISTVNASFQNCTTSSIDVPKGNLPLKAVIITIVGMILMDFSADICQSPVRAYLLEVAIPDDHAKGLSMFTVMAGIGGFLGYSFGGINWDSLTVGTWIGGNIKFVFMKVTIIFIVCVTITVTTLREIPLKMLFNTNKQFNNDNIEECEKEMIADNNNTVQIKSFKDYLKSTIFMPNSMKILYVTNLITWMSHLSYVLYFTDFVGEAVFGGDPTAPQHSSELNLYNEGLRFGCWGLAIYALSCAIYSFMIEYLIKKFKAKLVYISGLILYAIGMAVLAVIKTKSAVLIFSITAGIAYSTLFNIPYLLIANYHTKGMFQDDAVPASRSNESRGLGTDISIIGSTVFIAQLVLSLALSIITKLSRNTSIAIWAAAVLSGLAALGATKITYLDL